MKTIKSKMKNTLNGINNRFDTAEVNLKTRQYTLQTETEMKTKKTGKKNPNKPPNPELK